MKKLSYSMVAESVAAKIFKIGSVVFEIWPFYHIALWSAFVSITKYTWAPQTVHNTPVMNILKGYFCIKLF